MTETEKKKNGRPIEWTEERISALSNKLTTWAEKEDSYALVQFRRDENITRRTLHYLSSKDENFLNALMYSKACVASRMIENLNSKKGNCHPAFFNKYIRYNDLDLHDFMKQQEKRETEEVSKHVVKIIDFAKHLGELNGKDPV